jgi:mono/diheme cytochrome c family protein
MPLWNKSTGSLKWSISLILLALLIWVACSHPYTQGENLYKAYCVNCHIEDGTGLVTLIPRLAGADFLQVNRDLVPCIIRHGSMGGLVVNGTTFTEPMPGFRNLNEVEISNLINYINTSWGNNLPETSPEEVLNALDKCPEEPAR